MTLRAPTLDDLPVLVDFFSSLEGGGTGGATEPELREWFTSPLLDPVQDFRMLVEDGRVVGWCDVRDRDRTRTRIDLDVRARPSAGFAYEALLDWGIGRAREQARGAPSAVRVLIDPSNEVSRTAVVERGFRPFGQALRMEIDLPGERASPVWPGGISARAFREADARAVHEAECEIFACDWNFVALDFDDWCELHLGASEFDPSLWFLARDGDEIAGLSLCRSERRPETGHVGTMGVRSPWRRRGLGLALLLCSLEALRDRGRPKADLGVEADNVDAIRLYERAGFRTVQRTDTYELKL